MAVALQPHMTHTGVVCTNCGVFVAVGSTVRASVLRSAAVLHERECRDAALAG